MKKIGKKVSFLTKIMLVIGLLISNLSSLSIVFAYEVPNMIDISVVDNGFEINYLDELAEDVETVNVVLYENYTYLDGTSYCEDLTCEELGRKTTYSLTAEKFLEGLSIEKTILSGMDDEVLENIEVFDGLYELRVEVTDALGNEIGENVYSKNIEHEKGLDIKVYNSVNEEDVLVSSVNGKYPVSQNAKVVAKILAGGLSPADTFEYKDGEIHAYDLLSEEFVYEIGLNGHLYGEYNLPVDVTISEELAYTENVELLYGEYLDNAIVLNEAASAADLDSGYIFYGEGKEGTLYTLLDLENTDTVRTMLDLYNIVNPILEGNSIISYVLSNSEYEDVLTSYNMAVAAKTSVEGSENAVAEDNEVTLEKYLSEIILDDTAVLTLTSKGVTEDGDDLTIAYDVVVVGDVVSDNVIDEKDVLELINQVVSGDVKDTEKSDLIGDDEKVDILDVMYLNQVVETADWYVELSWSEEMKLNARLDVLQEELSSGDTFDVQYVLSLSDYDVNGLSGALKYDKNLFELVSVSVAEEWVGSNKDGKFLYITDEKLTAPVEEAPEEGITETPNEDTVETVTTESTESELEEEEEVPTNEYVIVNATFKALKATTLEDNSVITLENIELFDDATYIELDNTKVSTNAIEVSASDNNKLSSLIVAGQEIVLEENVYEYKLTVTNDVTVADIVYELENLAASVTSIISPEELVEGENKITITVLSESGIEQVYTIIVTREASEKKEETVTTVNNYYGDYDNDQEEEVIVTPAPEEEEVVEPEEKNGTLSRVIIIILILLVIAGLIYLIFKDEDDDETKKTNKAINKLKKEDKEPEVKTTEKKTDNSSKNKTSKNNKKER